MNGRDLKYADATDGVKREVPRGWEARQRHRAATIPKINALQVWTVPGMRISSSRSVILGFRGNATLLFTHVALMQLIRLVSIQLLRGREPRIYAPQPLFNPVVRPGTEIS